jgi:hypothetical protein
MTARKARAKEKGRSRFPEGMTEERQELGPVEKQIPAG